MSRRKIERINEQSIKPEADFDISKLTFPRDAFDLISVDSIETWQEPAKVYDKLRKKFYHNLRRRTKYLITIRCKRCGHIKQFQDSPTLTCRNGPCSFTWRDFTKEDTGDTIVREYVYVQPDGKKPGWYWRCSCADCGTDIYLTSHQIQTDHSRYCKRCGYAHSQDNRRLPKDVAAWNKYYGSIVRRSLEFGDVCDMTKEEIMELTTQPCYYCGAEPKARNKYLFRNGLDRIDSSRGYIKSNCVPCCRDCNIMKMDRPVSVWFNKMQHILDYCKERSTTIPQGSTPKQVEIDSPEKEDIV